MSSQNDDGPKVDLESAWKFFSVCEERQKFYSQSRNTIGSVLITIGGALLAFVFQDGKIGGLDYVVGGLVGWLGMFGFLAILQCHDTIRNWNERAKETMKEIDRLSLSTFSSKYIEEKDPYEHSTSVLHGVWNYIKSIEGLYAGLLFVIAIIGAGIATIAFVLKVLEYF